MALNLRHSKSGSIPFEGLNQKQFLAIAFEAAQQLNWKINIITENGFVAGTKISLSSWGEEIEVLAFDDFGSISVQCIRNQIFDWGKNNKIILQFTNKFFGVKESVPVDALLNKYRAAFISGISDDESFLEEAAPLQKAGSFLSLFIPKQGYVMTPVLVNLNILVFVLMLFSGVNVFAPTGDMLVSWGANYRPVTIEGQWWRLISNCFVHIGILHLLMNMYALIYIGLLLEPRIGKTRFLSAYLLTGICASACSLWWNSNTISAGASGAIFGMYGVFIAMLTTGLIEKNTRTALITSISIFVGYNLLNGLKDGTDGAAHIGGITSGFITGLIFLPALKKPWNDDIKMITISLASVIAFGASSCLYYHSTNDMPKYEAKMKKFQTMEKLALEIYELPQTTPKEKLLSEIREKGLYYWDAIETLLNDAEKLDISAPCHARDKALLEYTGLRIKSYNMMYLWIQTDSKAYRDSISFYDNLLQKKISQLKALQ